jgi:hypothetical protein
VVVVVSSQGEEENIDSARAGVIVVSSQSTERNCIHRSEQMAVTRWERDHSEQKAVTRWEHDAAERPARRSAERNGTVVRTADQTRSLRAASGKERTRRTHSRSK